MEEVDRACSCVSDKSVVMIPRQALQLYTGSRSVIVVVEASLLQHAKMRDHI